MNNLTREEFAKRMMTLIFGSAFIPKFLNGRPVTLNPDIPESIPVTETGLVKGISPFAIIDLHCHPSLKMYLLKKKFWKRHHGRKPGDNLIHQQEDTNEFLSGNVRGILAAHYLVEGGIKKNWTKVRFLWPAISKFLFPLADKIEHEDDSNFTQINIMIDTLESQIHIANEKQDEIEFVIARNFTEFEYALNRKDKTVIPIAHSIEGAHALGRNFPITEEKKRKLSTGKFLRSNKMYFNNDPNDATLYIRNLEALKARGVCLITLGHFFPNDLVYPVEGISHDGKKLPGVKWFYDPSKDKPLMPIGIAVVKKMLDIGMIVDLTHSTPQARLDVYKINQDRKKEGKEIRPLTFSHVGSQKVFETYGTDNSGKVVFPNYNYYNVSSEDINGIEKSNGVIGVIPENFWLAGGDTHLKEYGLEPNKFRYGIDFMIKTIKDINSQTISKNYDHVAIGTDFDGLADNPEDLYLNGHLSSFVDQLRNDTDFQKYTEMDREDFISKITYKNAQRLLRFGWIDNNE